MYGYIRVSTDSQDVEAQKIGISEKGVSLGVKIERWVEDDGISGTVVFEKRKLGKLMRVLKKGDMIIASELSRFSRKMFLLFEFLSFVTKNEVGLWTVKDAYHLDGSLQSTIMAFAFGIAAQIERDMISKRTKEGLEQRRREGVVLGRPVGSRSARVKMTGKDAQIEKFLRMGLSYATIAKLTKVNRLTVRNFCRANGLEDIRWTGKEGAKARLSKSGERAGAEASVRVSTAGVTAESVIESYRETLSLTKTAWALAISVVSLRTAVKRLGIQGEIERINAEARARNPSLSGLGRTLGLKDTREVRRYLREHDGCGPQRKEAAG